MRRAVLLLLVLAMALLLSSCSAGPPGRTRTVKKQFYADSPEDKYGFDSKIQMNGKSYTLQGEKYRVVKKTVTPPSELTSISGESDAFAPGKTFQLGDSTYTVQSVKTKPETVTKKVAVEDENDVPQTLTSTYTDRKENLKAKLYYQLDDVSGNKSGQWTDAKPFTINLIGYGQKYYDIGTAKLSGKNTLQDVRKKQKQVLKAQGENPDKNRISDVQWIGDPYRDASGNQCRDIKVSVQTKNAKEFATYSATLYRYSVKYVPEEARPEQYLLEGTATYAPVRGSSSPAGWVRVTLTAVLAAGIVLILLLIRYIWKEYRLVKSGAEIREIDGVRYTEDDF